MKYWSLSGLWFCLLAVTAFGADIYVSPTGSDAAAGTLAAPFASIARARDKADSLKSGGSVTVWLRGGTYYLSAPVSFGQVNSGTAAAPITYKAYNGEKPVLSGGIKVTTAWTTSSGSVMKTTIAPNLKVDQLFLNGQRQVLARFPNWNPKTLILEGYGTWSNITARTSRWANVAEGPAYVRALHSSQWGGEDFKVTSASGTTINTTWVGDNNRGQAFDQNHVLIENIYEELDTVGEWYYKKSTGDLYFWPPAGTTLSTATVELASQDGLLRFVGSSNDDASAVQYITFDGITFTHTYRTLFSGTFEGIRASDWAIVRNGTVYMENAENITIKNCQFDQVGGNGIFMSSFNRHNVIYNNVFNGGGASPVCLSD